MIKNFEKYTEELNDYERLTVLPEVEQILLSRIGSNHAITNKTVVKMLRARGIETDEPRIRKVIHNIRVSCSIPWLIASSKGYYVATSVAEMQTYIDSLEARANSILLVSRRMRKTLTAMGGYSKRRLSYE